MRSPSSITIRSSALEWALLSAALLLLAAALAAWRWREYDASGLEQRQRLELQAHALSDHLALVLQAVDNALLSVRVEAEAEPGLRGAMSSRLRDLDEAAAAISQLEIVDGDGLVLASSVAGRLRSSMADRPCFKRAQAVPEADRLYVCEPLKGAGGTWTVGLLRATQEADGRFQGVVAATLDSGYLGTVLPSALYAGDMRALLLYASGVVIASAPGVVVPAGTDTSKAPGTPFNRYRTLRQSNAVIDGMGALSGLDIIVAFRTIESESLHADRPLLLALSRTSQAAYRPWLVGTWQIAIAWLLVAGASGVSLHLMQRRRRAQAQQAVRSQKQRLEELESIERVVSGADLSLWTWHVAARRLDIDARWCAMMGRPTEDFSAAIDTWRSRVHPDDIAVIDQVVSRHFKGEIDFAQCECRLRHHDGHWVWVHTRGKVVERDAAGAPLRVAGTHQDITERKTAEEALRRSEAQVRLITEALPSAVGRLDIERRFLFTNPALERWLGEPGRAVIGRTLPEVLGDDAFAAVEHLARRVEAGEEINFEATIQSPARGAMEVLVHLTPDFDAAGAVCGHFAILTDLTERRSAEAERRRLEDHLREAQKMESLGTLAGGIAHDFNNVLGAIIGNAELAHQEVGAGHPAAENLQQIGQAGRRARGLVQQILTFSRRQIQERTNQPLRPLVEETVSMLRATLPARVTLTTDLTDVPLYVNADATQMHQVLMNLGTNAWHALQGSTGRIEVGLEDIVLTEAGPDAVAGLPAGQYAHLWVRDDGAGMDAATRQRIFEPFFTTKPVGKGTGLGLSVVHGIVRTHLGAITVESTPGQQTCFHVYLPATSRPSQVGDLEQAEARVMQGRGQHVMYVDDDETMVLLVERLLDRAGYRVTGCKSAKQALAAFSERPRDFDLLVTDFNMPDFSGLELAAELARIRPDLPIVISSGYLGDELRAGAQRAGIRHVMQKQNTFEELTLLVHRALAQAEVTRELKA